MYLWKTTSILSKKIDISIFKTAEQSSSQTMITTTMLMTMSTADNVNAG